jgi:hypothetical protein
MLDLENSDCNEVAEDKRKGISAKPYSSTQGLLRGAIPERGDESEPWR